MATNTRERSEALQQAARHLLEERQVDITGQVELRPLAKEFAALTDCHYSTARHHMATAVRRARGEETERQRGGAREGAGYPKGVPRSSAKQPRSEPQTVTLRAGNPIHANIIHPDGGYEPIGRGVVTIEWSAPERLVKVDLGGGQTLVLTVF